MGSTTGGTVSVAGIAGGADSKAAAAAVSPGAVTVTGAGTSVVSAGAAIVAGEGAGAASTGGLEGSGGSGPANLNRTLFWPC